MKNKTNKSVPMCKWYTLCQYGKWEFKVEGETSRGWPVVIQEKTCAICGKVRIRKASCLN